MSTENNKKPNKFLSVLWIVFLGLVFGICAAVAFTGLSFVSNRFIVPSIAGEMPQVQTVINQDNADPVKPQDKESD